MKPITFMPLSYFKLQSGPTIIMHLSFSSLAPWYTGTSGDRGHTRSLEADKFLWLISADFPAGQGRTCQILAHMIPIKPRPQPRTCNPPVGMSACTNPLHYHDKLPRYLGAGDTNDRCISIPQNLYWCYTCRHPCILKAWQGHNAIHCKQCFILGRWFIKT